MVNIMKKFLSLIALMIALSMSATMAFSCGGDDEDAGGETTTAAEGEATTAGDGETTEGTTEETAAE